MSTEKVPSFIYVRDRQNNSDLMVATNAIRYIAQNDKSSAITFIDGGTQEVLHTIPELVAMINGDPNQAEKDLQESRSLTEERTPSTDPYELDDDGDGILSDPEVDSILEDE